MTEPRQLALETLYEIELNPSRDVDLAGLAPKAARLVTGVTSHRHEIDAHIERSSEHWRIRRMPVIDATILRIGTYELAFEDTPTAVVINEAVELAKAYSTQASGAFVNGLLAGVAQAVRTDG